MSLKRKQSATVSPELIIRSIRRRFFSASASTMSEAQNDPASANISDQNDQNCAQDESYTLNLPPFNVMNFPHVNIQTEEGGNIDLTQAIMSLLSSPQFSAALAAAIVPAMVPVLTPLLSSALSADIQNTVKHAVQDAVKPLKDEISHLTSRIDANERDIACVIDDNNVDFLGSQVKQLRSDMEDLRGGLEQLEQYGRRNSLRFHNVTVPESGETDDAIVKLCRDKLDVTITSEDICRSHPIGSPNRYGKSQVICRFRNWKLKNQIYRNKRKLKNDNDHVFITEDLTSYRQEIVSEMSDAKRAGKLHSFWSNDGRLFIKQYERSRKILISSIDELHSAVPP